MAQIEPRDAAMQNDISELFLQPIDLSNQFEEVVARLIRAIRLGIVPVGERFPAEREVSELLGVSRATVREAVRGLEQAGYVEIRRGRNGGAFVIRDEAVLSPQDRERALGPQLLEALDYRLALEPGVAALAASRRDRGQLKQIRAFLTEVEEEADSREFIRKNCRLHILFAEASGSQRLHKAVAAVELEVMDAFLATPDLETNEARSHAQHRRILEAISKGNPAAARKATETHLTGTAKIMRELVAPSTVGH